MAARLRGGDKLEAALRQISEKIGKGAKVRVGFLENATYPDGTPVAKIAAINEFGAPSRNQPPRPFFRNMIAAKSPEWGPALGKLVKDAGYDANQALGQMGEGIAGQLRQSITDFTDPPLAPATIAAKGFDKPLVNTGHMLASVDKEVVDS